MVIYTTPLLIFQDEFLFGDVLPVNAARSKTQ
jgi:hypothetical protein